MSLKTLIISIFLVIALERAIFALKQKEKDGNIEYIWTSGLLISSYILCVCLALFEFFMWRNNLNIRITAIGLLIMLGGIFLRRFAVKALGDNWSIHIRNIIAQELIKTGPYKWLRHPYYAAVIFELVGMSLYLNSILSLFYVFLIQFPLLLVRISLEEKTLFSKFQNQYKQYCQETGMFLSRKQ